MKKKPFLLLEILIGIFLITLIGLPLLTKPIYIYRHEISALKEMEGERLADWTFVEIKEKLLKNEIPWEQLPKEGEKKNFSLDPLPIYLSEAKSIQRSFSLQCYQRQERDGENHELYRLLKVKIFFDPPLHKPLPSNKKGKREPYTYDLFVRRLPKT